MVDRLARHVATSHNALPACLLHTRLLTCHHHLALASCRVLGSALLLWIPLMPLFFVLRQFLRSQAGTSK